MIPVLLLALGLGLVIAGWVVLRSLGPRVRVGRLLAVTPQTSVADANASADAGSPRYVRVDGRIDSDAEFEDADHRPLVFRRTRLDARDGRGWRTLDDRRQQVPFTLNEGLDSIAIDTDALDAGLVVVPRESRGTAAELGEAAPQGIAPDAEVRVRVEHVSSVEHAIALGVPVRRSDGVVLTAGLGRPLVLTTLDTPSAMRVLAEGRPGRPRAAAALLVLGVATAGVGAGLLLVDALT